MGLTNLDIIIFPAIQREVRARRRKYKKETVMDTSTEKKHKAQQKNTKYREEESEADDTSTSCLDTDTDTTKVPASKKQQHRKGKGKDFSRRTARITRNTAASSDNTDAAENDTTLGSERRGNSSSSKRGRTSKHERAVGDDSSMEKPISNSRGGIRNHEVVMMHASSRQDYQKQPPPPRKNRVRKIVEQNARHESGAQVSPLYYQASPGTEDEVTQARSGLPGKTPSSVERSSESQGSVDSQVTSDQGNEKSQPEFFPTKHPSKANGAPATLNLQQEILAVVEKHKQGRIAKMRERSVRITASSLERVKVCNSSSTSDVYDLSDDEDNPQRVLFTHTSTTTGGSISNWSEEGDKSVNMTWVTRGKPRRRVYGTPADPNYNTDETTTETTNVSNSENPSNVVNISSSDAETLVTKSSEDGDNLGPVRKNYKKSSGSLPRKVPQRTPVQTPEDDHTHEQPVVAKVVMSSTRQFLSSEASSEDTGDTSRRQKQPVRRGLSKKAVVIQRHQPRRNCQKTESDSETKKTPQNHVTESKNQATAWHQKAHSKTTAAGQVSDRDGRGSLSTNRLHQETTAGSSAKANAMQRGRVQSGKTRERHSNGTPSIDDANEDSIWQTDEAELSQR